MSTSCVLSDSYQIAVSYLDIHEDDNHYNPSYVQPQGRTGAVDCRHLTGAMSRYTIISLSRAS